MKYISIIFILLLTSACLSPAKKGKKFTWQDDTSQERTISGVNPHDAASGEFIYVTGDSGRFQYLIHDMNRYCDTNKVVLKMVNKNMVICVRK